MAYRRLCDAVSVLGEMSQSEKRAFRSHFVRQGQDKEKMPDAEYRLKYAKENLGWIPEVVKRYFNYESHRI